MNEKIKELMLAAGYAAPELAGRAHRLAELIISECALMATRATHVELDPAACIKEHFGVSNEDA
jgi:hypothetical protein